MYQCSGWQWGRAGAAETRLYLGQFINMPPLVPTEYSAQPPFLALFHPVWAVATDACSPFLTSFFFSVTLLKRTHIHHPPVFVRSQVVSKLVQIREYISKASSMRDDLVEKNDVPANVERLSHLIDHLKEQEKSYLRFLQKMLVSLSFLPS